MDTCGPGQDSVTSQGDFSAGQRLIDTHLEPLCSHYNTLTSARLMAEKFELQT